MSEAVISDRILNLDKTDYEKPSLFMGQQLGLVDSLNTHYPDLYKLYKDMKAKDWDELEFKFGSSTLNSEFKTCPKNNYDIMIRTLAWQWEADSVASRSIMAIVSPFITNSELYYGWQRIADNECLVDGTEVLTPQGWIDLKYILPNTLVAQYDPISANISWTLPINYIEKDYEGDVFSFRNDQGHFYQVVTPGHRMLKRKNTTNESIVELAETMDYTKGTAGDGISGISSGFINEGFYSFTPLEAFLIAVQADGAISDRYTGEIVGTVPVRFSFSKERKIERLKVICEYAKLELIELSGSEATDTAKAKRNFKVNVPIQYAQYLKNFNWVNLQDKGRTWCEFFLEEIIHWDGHYTKNTGILHTTSRQAVEVVQAVASLCGMKTHLQRYTDDRSENYSDCWRISWKRQDYVSGQTIKKETIKYSGKVRCITVPTGFFLMRYKDAVSVTGNCIHALTYSEIVKNSFDNPSEVLNEILSIKEAFSRLEIVSEIFDKALKTGAKLTLGQVERNQETYNDIFMFVVAIYCLEAIQFMSSFGITFAMGNAQEFIPISLAVQKIAIDEFYIHRVWDRTVLDIELGNEYGLTAFNKNRTKILNLINSIVRSEMSWNDYTFSEGREHPGLNKDVLNKGVLFYAKEVYEFFGFTKEEIPFELPNKNPLLYMNDWLEIDKMQTSPMEQKSGNYVLGMIAKDSSENEVLDIELD